MVIGASYLGTGSATFHACQTDVGHSMDVRLMDLYAYIGYQASMQALQPIESAIIHDLSETPR